MTTDKFTLPPLAGICGIDAAGRPGISVEATVRRIRRYAFLHTQLIRVISAHLNGITHWEVKEALSLHLWQNAEHNTWFRNRVTEMRQPPLHLDRSPDPALACFFDELIRSSGTLEFLVGIFEVLLPALIQAMEEHLAESNPLTDYPTSRILRFCLLEKHEQQKWARQALAVLGAPNDSEGIEAWKSHLQDYLMAAGGIHGEAKRLEKEKLPPPRAAQPFEPERVPRRENRFQNVRNSRGKLLSGDEPLESRLLYMAYVRYTEMHVPELLALIVHDWTGQPWSFYHDLCRHLWDEARHSMLGKVIFSINGIDTSEMVQEISLASYPNSELPPRERYALLWGIEQGLMDKKGKQAEFALARDNGAPLLATFQDFDWADEVLHAQIGRRWLLPAFKESRDALNDCYQTVRQKYDALINEDREKPGADWWNDFYEQIKRRHKRQALSL